MAQPGRFIGEYGNCVDELKSRV